MTNPDLLDAKTYWGQSLEWARRIVLARLAAGPAWDSQISGDVYSCGIRDSVPRVESSIDAAWTIALDALDDLARQGRVRVVEEKGTGKHKRRRWALREAST